MHPWRKMRWHAIGADWMPRIPAMWHARCWVRWEPTIRAHWRSHLVWHRSRGAPWPMRAWWHASWWAPHPWGMLWWRRRSWISASETWCTASWSNIVSRSVTVCPTVTGAFRFGPLLVLPAIPVPPLVPSIRVAAPLTRVCLPSPLFVLLLTLPFLSWRFLRGLTLSRHLACARRTPTARWLAGAGRSCCSACSIALAQQVNELFLLCYAHRNGNIPLGKFELQLLD
mmetsp:Transcript_91546/g.267900  ORF Transcript_91546/g.267900 Transcript_91546/m.267900 type:complete len:227 (-) Transcript_91546:983-1663(-)